MSIRQIFKCDICSCEFSSRDENGNPRIIGGIKGVIEKDGIKNVDMDFCPNCYIEIIKFIIKKQHEHRHEQGEGQHEHR